MPSERTNSVGASGRMFSTRWRPPTPKQGDSPKPWPPPTKLSILPYNKRALADAAPPDSAAQPDGPIMRRCRLPHRQNLDRLHQVRYRRVPVRDLEKALEKPILAVISQEGATSLRICGVGYRIPGFSRCHPICEGPTTTTRAIEGGHEKTTAKDEGMPIACQFPSEKGEQGRGRAGSTPRPATDYQVLAAHGRLPPIERRKVMVPTMLKRVVVCAALTAWLLGVSGCIKQSGNDARVAELHRQAERSAKAEKQVLQLQKDLDAAKHEVQA